MSAVVTSLAPTSFAFENTVLRVVVDARGGPWFVAGDVCAALDLSNTTMAMGRLDEDEKGLSSIDTPGGVQQISTISESGLYSLVLGSRKSGAKRFKRWVTHEVLPAIRRTGAYMPPARFQVPQSLADALRLAADLADQKTAADAALALAAPKAQALDKLAAADGALCITDAAKALQMRPKDLFAWLQAHQWIFRRHGSTGWVGYQARIQVGYLAHKVTTLERPDGTEKVVERVLVTPKGLAKLAEALATAEGRLQ